jgi:anthranilate synthase component I
VRSLSFDDYERFSSDGRSVPVFREVPGDRHTPVSAFLSLGAESPQAFLLESVVGGERIARYSFLGRGPSRTLRFGAERKDAFPSELRTALSRQAALVPGLPRFTGGAVGYLSYDAVRMFENLPDRHGPSTAPLASFGLYRDIVAFDHVLQRIILISDAEPGRRAAFDDAQARLDSLEDDLSRPPSQPLRSAREKPSPRAAPGFDRGDEFRTAVGRAKEYIAAGDAFQVVLSRQARLASTVDPFAVYRALRMINPSPYMYFLKDGPSALAGASPEMLVRVEGRQVETRPIAGTRRRGANAAEDDALAAELLADPKERAEHLMLVDLGRNDLGRVSRFGSVRVPEFMAVERYSHVAHLVSLVTGELREDQDALDALVATFPAGTLSGAPKIRAMEIIDELEGARRGVYGGALGYVDLRGNLDFCIAIRTVVFDGNTATVQAGAGIVADSDPRSEERETEAKAAAMLEALQLAEVL